MADVVEAVVPLSPAQIARFRVEGFLHDRAILAPDDVAGFCGELGRLAVEGGAVPWTGPWVASETGHGYAPVRYLAERSAPWKAFCADLGRRAAQLLGDQTAVLYEATGILKPPQLGQSFPWHQDGAYYGPIDGHYVIANLYLDDVTPENGSLQVVPCSHRAALAHVERDGKKVVALDGTPVEPQAKAGDVVWFHLWTVHGSPPNHGSTPRRAVRLGYTSEQR